MSSRKEALVILIPGFPKDEADSTCLPSQQQFVLALKAMNPQVAVIVLSFQYPYHTKRYSWHGIPVIPFGGRNRGGLSKLLVRRKIFRALKKIHQTHTIKGLLSFWCGECAFVGKQFADKQQIRHLCWIMGQDARKQNKYPRKTEFRAEELIALSDFLQEEFEKNHGIRPAYVIPPGISNQSLPEKTVAKDIDLLAAGSLIPLKQFEIFLDVVATVKKQRPAVKAMLIGDGPEKNRLIELTKMLGLTANVTMTGELPHQQVLQQMQRARLFLHPSSYEGFSGVCLEALAAGCHVISFCRAMRHDIDQWHIVNNEEQLTKKTIALLTDKNTIYQSVMPYTATESVKRMTALFSLQGE